MIVETKNLTGAALDWAVAKCEGHAVVVFTVEEQRQRWFSDVSQGEKDKATKDFETYILPTLKPKVCVRGVDDYKRNPTLGEVKMLWGEGVPRFAYSSSWAQGGPIIEREGISIGKANDPDWWAFKGWKAEDAMPGPTPLIAAMRCYVASKLGDTVDIPEELL